MSEIDFQWNDPQLRWTKNGMKYLKTAPILPEWNDAFWIYWKRNSESMRAKGYSTFKDKAGKWFISQWFNEVPVGTKILKKKQPEINMVSDLELTPLKNSTGLKSWQIGATERLIASIKKHGSAIDASETGCGKSYCAVAVARELKLKIGVICPLAVCEPWRRVIEDHFGMKVQFIKNYESLRTGKYGKDIVKWGKLNDSKAKNARNAFIWKCSKDTLLIFDEAHKCKGLDTKNSKLLKSAKDAGYKILCCSATSAINPLELRAMGYALGLHTYKNFYMWIQDNGCKKGRFGYEFNGDKYVLQTLHKQMILDRGVRLKRDDIPDFPESDIQAIAYSVGTDAELSLKTIYTSMMQELKTLETRTGKNKSEDNQLVIKLRARQKSELIKVPLFVELAERALEDDMSVVLFLNFRDSITSVAERLGTSCIVWGDNKGNERQKCIDEFQSDKSRVIIVNIQSGNSGIGLHDITGKHPRIALISPDYSAVNLKQVLGRVQRTGGKTKSLQRIVYAANTVEEEVCRTIQYKLKNMDIINDSDCSPETTKIFK